MEVFLGKRIAKLATNGRKEDDGLAMKMDEEKIRHERLSCAKSVFCPSTKQPQQD
jgi:hypothetical protein